MRTDVDVFLKLNPIQLMAITAFGEVRSEGLVGMEAVLCVVRTRCNRVPRFGDMDIFESTNSSVHAVCLKIQQFSIYNPGNVNFPILSEIANNFNYFLDSNPVFHQAFESAEEVWNGCEDITFGADHYHAVNVHPEWADIYEVTTQIGNHIFYRSNEEFN